MENNQGERNYTSREEREKKREAQKQAAFHKRIFAAGVAAAVGFASIFGGGGEKNKELNKDAPAAPPQANVEMQLDQVDDYEEIDSLIESAEEKHWEESLSPGERAKLEKEREDALKELKEKEAQETQKLIEGIKKSLEGDQSDVHVYDGIGDPPSLPGP